MSTAATLGIVAGGIAIFLLLVGLCGVRVAYQYERVVVFILGRLIAAKGPGIFWVPPFCVADQAGLLQGIERKFAWSEDYERRYPMRFWHRDRTDYFTQGLTDGKKAALHSLPTVEVGTAQVREQAQVAAAALPGRVAPADARNYQSGWVEGYNTMRERAPQTPDGLEP